MEIVFADVVSEDEVTRVGPKSSDWYPYERRKHTETHGEKVS